MKRENVFVLAVKLGAEIGSLYRDNRYDRTRVMEFMDANGWFGVDYVMKECAPWVAASKTAVLREPLTLWLSAYLRCDRERTSILLNRFDGVYPKTCGLYKRFLTDEDLWDNPSAWKLLGFLFATADKELTAYGEYELERLIGQMDAELPRTAAKMFARFIGTAAPGQTALSDWTYTFKERGRPSRINEAYPISDFALMSYCVQRADVGAAGAYRKGC